jgi:hypothetical protein
VDPNPKESEGSGRIRIRKNVRIWLRIRIQILQKNKNTSEKSEVKHLKENKMHVFFYRTFFLLFYRFRNTDTGTYERSESHSLENCHVKILVLESESENIKQISGSQFEPEKISSDQQHSEQ